MNLKTHLLAIAVGALIGLAYTVGERHGIDGAYDVCLRDRAELAGLRWFVDNYLGVKHEIEQVTPKGASL